MLHINEELLSYFPGTFDDGGQKYFGEREKSAYPVRGVIRQSFSLETTTTGTTPRYEALKSRRNSTRSVNGPEEVVDKFNTLKRRQDVDYNKEQRAPYGTKSYEERLAESASRDYPGPRAHVQQIPRRHWVTEANVFREDDIDGSLNSFSYETPSSTQWPSAFRGTARYTTPPYSSPELEREQTRSGKRLLPSSYNQRNDDTRRAYIPPTTYRPKYSVTRAPSTYSFFMRTQNHSRQENGDSTGNFRGSIKFFDTFGNNKEVHYQASPEGGIVTSDAPFVSIPGRSGQRNIPSLSTQSPLTGSSTYEFSTSEPSVVSTGSVSYDNGQSFPTTDNTLRVNSGRTREHPDGSYAFSYDAGDHRRQEARTGDGIVRGMYSFEGPDGEHRRVEYEASARNGFVARGRDLPGQLTGGYLPPSGGLVSSGVSPASGVLPVEYGAGYYQPLAAEDRATPEGTYYFSYDAGDHARDEVRDGNGNVSGSYSFLTGDGLRQTVHYEASPEGGFRIKSSHVSY